MDLFRVRLNCIDHYQGTATRYDPQLRNDVRPSQVSRGPKVPVVRIFGSTETGQKVCAHVHGAFPYLYVEYNGGLASEEVGAFIYRLHLSIDHALAVSYRRDQYGDNAKFVARITLVKGIPFYGFHVGYRYFLKIYMFNPIVMTRLADLLQQGVIMKRKFQPYEAHLQYLLQFMVDYNLYGCDYLDSSKVNFRSPVPQHDQDSNSSHLWHSVSVPEETVTDDPMLPRVSHCSIEVDICVQNIVNRKMVKERQLHHDFIERKAPIPKDLKYVYSMAGLWKDETKRRQRQMPKDQQHNSPFPAEILVSMSADPRDSQPQGWIHEDDYRKDIHDLVSQEATALEGADLSFETFAKPDDPEPDVNTVLQSVEDLYPTRLMSALGLPPNPDKSALDPASSIEVDEKKALQVQEEDAGIFPDDSDEETFQDIPGDKLVATGGRAQSTMQPTALSQIAGPTPKNKHGFKFTQKPAKTSVEHEVQYMSTMSLEIHVNSRGKYIPNPEEDEIQCVFWACKSDEKTPNTQDSINALQSGVLVLSADGTIAQRITRMTNASVAEEDSELGLIVRMVEIVRTFDPDVLTGFEVHGSSWGYLIERARLKYDYDLCDEFSRMRSDSHGRFGKNNDRWGFNTTSTIRVTGRHMINIWRAMQGELNLLQYTMENVVWHLLHRRVPHYTWKTLTKWYKSNKPAELAKLLRYYYNRTRLDIEILEANELIARTSEQARLLGVDFFSVFSRGSQFKVESIMSRIAKPENFVFVSPSKKQVGGQNALECLPLVMEPQSAFYSSPLLVLDFQSLYPSVMIAYNYCYSTFLGRIKNWRGASKMGFTEYDRQKGLLLLLKDYINIAPNGMMYVKAEIRKSLLAKMLTEILETRVMVKSGMKKDKDDKTLQQLLNNRQLALKLLANVTYGYTSASFSGRMPCSEIADSIVQTGRETLERAIAYIHSVEKWGAEVVYGDTDSLFVYLKGRTRDQAFDIGNEIAKAVTEMNPRPIKLKFEKVYHPCVLLAKKRYVGYKYESKSQVKPDFDAKGIETVRRDGTPAEQKIEEKALRMLFETADLSQIKAYFQSQCDKIMRGAVSVQDFCFAKEVRLGTYSDKGPPPAGALISTKKMLEDARAEPQYGERVPYVVISGAPGSRLIDRCVAPEDLLVNPHWQLDAEYYISKNLIPPLERIFNLVGANVRQWYDEMPKVQRVHHQATSAQASKKSTLESYMRSTHCLVCNAKFAEEGFALCPSCRDDAPVSILALQTRLAAEERSFQEVLDVCRTCSGMSPLDEVRCDSKDCPVFWTRMKQRTRMVNTKAAWGPVIRELIEESGKERLEW
ncbi:DNA polymerase zeta catalytic subunit [Purpureocillium lavendulum]|uniref:DNA polymerase n=1 Tax=Purpureocillium lavendulum TaxID=1247861 RepID=A0AB34FZU6_9HYPO|nr:DNA polymerase zeta catalytic subunit [Purpureocillium lavendulum]